MIDSLMVMMKLVDQTRIRFLLVHLMSEMIQLEQKVMDLFLMVFDLMNDDFEMIHHHLDDDDYYRLDNFVLNK
jgi:hypothetical protein